MLYRSSAEKYLLCYVIVILDRYLTVDYLYNREKREANIYSVFYGMGILETYGITTTIPRNNALLKSNR